MCGETEGAGGPRLDAPVAVPPEAVKSQCDGVITLLLRRESDLCVRLWVLFLRDGWFDIIQERHKAVQSVRFLDWSDRGGFSQIRLTTRAEA